MELTPADIALLVPSVVAELAYSPSLLRYCAEHLELIVYIGGDLPQQVGNIVAAELPLRCQWGASEVGMPQQLIPAGLDPRRDWKYTRFHPCTGAVFQKASNGLYELVIQRKEALASTQPTFTIRGKENLEEYHTRDLFMPHPTVPDAWAWKARADDIVVFLNGEKTNPITMEQHIVSSNPGLVNGALVIGTHRFQAALLLEPAGTAPRVHTTAEQARFIERVWPSIQEANRVAPAHALVEKALVFVADPDRPLVRAGKGTLQRGASAALYEAEINALYENVEKMGSDEEDHDDDESTIVDETLGDESVVARHIRDAVLTVTDWTVLDDSESLFERGMDSLQALRLVRVLRQALHRPHLGLSTVYQNPTISELAGAVKTIRGYSIRDDRDIMEPLLKTYRQLINEIPAPETSSSLSSRKILCDIILTGSTGTLGSMILQALLDRKQVVGHVFCLNRGPDGGRLAQAKKWAGLNGDASILEERVTFLQANLAYPRLGLDPEAYEKLHSRVGLVIHSAWPVNFNLALSAFRPQLVGMVNLFSLAASSTRPMRVMFISSVGAVAASVDTGAPVPESIIDSLDAAHANGYSRSKLMSELLCDTASRHLDIPVDIARVGQVAGPANHVSDRSVMWNRSEWLPSLVISSFRCLGCLPDNLGPRFSQVDWIPSDLAGEVVANLATRNLSLPVPTPDVNSGRGRGNSPVVFNIRNPNTTNWAALLPAIQGVARYHLGKELEIVSPKTWLERLEKSGECDTDDASASTSNPAIKLLAFYRDGLWAHGSALELMSVENSCKASVILQNMPAVHADWMRKWIVDWLTGT